MLKNLPARWGGRRRFDPWIAKILWRREWKPTPVFLPGEFHGQSNLEGYSPWGHKESDKTERGTLARQGEIAFPVVFLKVVLCTA